MAPHNHESCHQKRAPLLHPISGVYGLLRGGGVLERTQWGFIIVLAERYANEIFSTAIRISRLTSVDHINRKPQLICNSSKEPYNITLSVNASTEKASAPKAMQFGTCFSSILQRIGEADPVDRPVCLSKWDISNAFHRCNLRLSDIGKFTYIVPPLAVDLIFNICIDLVLPMGWMNSPDLFCSTSETVTNNANSYALDPYSAFTFYPPQPGHTIIPMPRQPPPAASSTWTCIWAISSALPRGVPLSNSGLQAHCLRPKVDLPLLAGRGEGLSHPEKGVGRGRVLGYGQGDHGMGNQHSPGYPRPVLQTTDRAPLPSGNTHHLAPHIGQ